MKIRFRNLLTLGACWCFSLPLFAQTDTLHRQAPTLMELIDGAYGRSHMLAGRELDVESSELEIKQLKEIYLPRAEIGGKYGYLINSVNIDIPGSALSILPLSVPELQAGFNSYANMIKADLGLSSVLYSGGKVPALKRAVKEKARAQNAMIEKEKQQIISDVSKAYDQLALLKQVKRVLEESEKRLDANSRIADKAFEYGLITKYERQKIDVAKSQLAAKKQQYEGQKELLLKQLSLMTGFDTQLLASIEHELHPLVNPATGPDATQRPEVTALEASVEARRHQVTAARSWWVPKVQAASSIGYLNFFNTQLHGKHELPMGAGKLELRTNKLEMAPAFNIGVGFKWDVFDGLKGKREVQMAQIEVKKAEHERDEALEKLDLYLSKTKVDYTNAMADIRLRDKQREVADNALLQATKEFRTGLIKSADLIGAENDYQTASLEYYQAVFNQRQAAIEWLRATGSLNPSSIF